MLAQPLPIEERAALFAELNLEMVLALDTMLKGLIEEQRNPRPAAAESAPVVESAPLPMPAAEPTIYSDDFDYTEVTAHAILSAIIQGRYVGRSSMLDGGFEALYNLIHVTLLDMMRVWDEVEIEGIMKDLRGG